MRSGGGTAPPTGIPAQNHVLADDVGGVYFLATGQGGGTRAEIAAAATLRAAQRATHLGRREGLDGVPLVESVFHQAHAELGRLVGSQLAFERMASTLTAVILGADRVYCAGIRGRVWLVSDGTAQVVVSDSQSSLLGDDDAIRPVIVERPLRRDDTYVLASGGAADIDLASMAGTSAGALERMLDAGRRFAPGTEATTVVVRLTQVADDDGDESGAR